MAHENLRKRMQFTKNRKKKLGRTFGELRWKKS